RSRSRAFYRERFGAVNESTLQPLCQLPRLCSRAARERQFSQLTGLCRGNLGLLIQSVQAVCKPSKNERHLFISYYNFRIIKQHQAGVKIPNPHKLHVFIFAGCSKRSSSASRGKKSSLPPIGFVLSSLTADGQQ
ncbi:MAG: hypothetical protein N2235_17355, partial [Fischerella sp.]|nr:hypothetical protein [Fischerella sp.]